MVWSLIMLKKFEEVEKGMADADKNELLVFQDRSQLISRINRYLWRAKEGIVIKSEDNLEVFAPYSLNQKGLWKIMGGEERVEDKTLQGEIVIHPAVRRELCISASEYLQAVALAIQHPLFYPYWCDENRSNTISKDGGNLNQGFGYVSLVVPRDLGTIVTVDEVEAIFRPKKDEKSNGVDGVFKTAPFGEVIGPDAKKQENWNIEKDIGSNRFSNKKNPLGDKGIIYRDGLNDEGDIGE